MKEISYHTQRSRKFGMDNQSSSKWRKFVLLLNCITLSIGYCGGPLISRLYFLHGGQRIWLSSWLACIGWPIILIVLIIAYFVRRKTQDSDTNFFIITRREFTSSAALGILVGLAGYLYAWGPAKLPVSTSTIIYAAQLGFTVLFAFLIVKQKLTAYSTNAVVLLMVGAGTLALRADSDRPEGESTKQYVLGFVMTLLAAASTGLALPLLELIYMKAQKNVTYIMILEIEMILNIFGSAFCTVGMIVNKDFQVQ